VALKTALMLGVLGTVLVGLPGHVDAAGHSILLFLAVAGTWPRARLQTTSLFPCTVFCASPDARCRPTVIARGCRRPADLS
jgi:hypothetical protein